jgi:hypothetical protein
MKTSKIVSFAAAAFITALQVAALGVVLASASLHSGKGYAQGANLPAAFVLGSRTD